VLDHKKVSHRHATVVSQKGGPNLRDVGSTNGTFVNGERVASRVLAMGDVVRIGPCLGVVTLLPEGAPLTFGPLVIAGKMHPTLLGGPLFHHQLTGPLSEAARARGTLMLLGETGTGKSVIAEAVHASGPRQKGPCLTHVISPSEPVLESTLFGHLRGAFTNATDSKKGLFEQADGGTLFLDEVGEIPLPSQVTLLRAVETGQFLPVGAQRSVKVDVRIITATNRDLTSPETRGSIVREDLFHRLSGQIVRIPSLLDRRSELPYLAEAFATARGLSCHASAAEELALRPWPGNVRVLVNLLEAAANASEDGLLRAEDLPKAPSIPPVKLRGQPGPLDRERIEEVLSRGLNREDQARALGFDNWAAAWRHLQQPEFVDLLQKHKRRNRA
jgi:DNA-binding NtrC family response regulator